MKLLTLKEVVMKTGFKKSTIYKFIKTKNFPKPIKIGKSSRWIEDDVNKWIKNQLKNQNYFKQNI